MPANAFNGFTEYGIGIGLRVPHYRHILERKPVVDWFEIISENFMVDGGRPLEVLPIFNLTLVYNRGVSFGLFQSPEGQEAIRWTLAVFSLVVALGLIVWVRKVIKPLTAVAIGLIIGGALGNLIDRVRFGYVVDFLDFSGLHFPWVFNVADSGITIGVALLLAETLLTPDKVKQPSQ